MHFCNKCDNMYYIRLSEENSNEIIYYCRNCGNNDNTIIEDNTCVSKTKLSSNQQKYNLFVNKYTKLDPTLPRTNSIKCPNENCSTNHTDYDISNREIIFIRYDDKHMKYMYICCKCDYIWKTN